MSDIKTRLKQWLASGEISLHPPTFPQRELWECSPVPPGDPVNNVCAFIHLNGPITEKGSLTAVRRVVQKQETLRVSFLPGRDKPMQMLRKEGEVAVRFHKLPAAQNSMAAVDALAEEIFNRPFDMLAGPLYGAEVFDRGGNEFVLALSIHHAIADGWTLGIFVQDLFAAYVLGADDASAAFPPPPLTYMQWGAAERALWTPALIEERAEYWKARLAGTANLWPRTATAPPSGHAERRTIHLDENITGSMRNIAREQGATLFSAMLAAFQIALSKWTGVKDVLVGSPVANRSSKPVREVMGYCAGIVPLRGVVDEKRPFTESVRRVHDETMEAFANAMPFAEIARVVDPNPPQGCNPVFQVRFALQNHPVPDVELSGFSLRLRMRSTGTARFDIACELTEEGGRLEVAWLHRKDMFSAGDIAELDRVFRETLDIICRAG